MNNSARFDPSVQQYTTNKGGKYPNEYDRVLTAPTVNICSEASTMGMTQEGAIKNLDA